MFIIKIEGRTGYDKPFKEDTPWNMGELIRSFCKTFDGEVTVTVSNDEYKPKEDDDAGDQ